MMTEHRFTHAKWKANENIEPVLQLCALDFCLFLSSKIAGGAALPPEARRETKNSFDRLSRTLARGQSCSQIRGVITQHLLAKPDALAGSLAAACRVNYGPFLPCCSAIWSAATVQLNSPKVLEGSGVGMGAWLNGTFG